MVGKVDPAWRKSTFSTANGGACVEVGNGTGSVVVVRDTTQSHMSSSDRTAVPFDADAWNAFTANLK